MKIIVVGLGSMGKRRIRLLKQYFPFVQISGADKNQERREYSQKEYGITAYNSLEEAVREEFFDCAFVCTSPLSYNRTMSELWYACIYRTQPDNRWLYRKYASGSRKKSKAVSLFHYAL